MPSLGSVTITPEPKIPKPVMPFVPPHTNLKSKTVKVSKSPRPTVGFLCVAEGLSGKLGVGLGIRV